MTSVKNLALLVALMTVSMSAHAIALVDCAFSRTEIGYRYGVNTIKFERDHVAINYKDGSVEKLAPEEVRGQFGEILFPASMGDSFTLQEWDYVQVTSKKMGTIQTRRKCYFTGSSISCSSMNGDRATEAVAQFSISGQQLSFDGKELPRCGFIDGM